MNHGPLKGITVIEFAGIGPAPCAGMMLADLGADVLIIDRPQPASGVNGSSDASTQHDIVNRGKRSLTLDLKNSKAQDIALQLIATADILLEGFRPGVMERLGLGPDVCLSSNPRLIYGRMTGWGQTGPLAHAAGHDPNYIALTGALWAGISPERPPTAPLTLVGDLGGGTMMLMMGVLSALIHAKTTGQGQVIDCAITDGTAYLSTLLRFMLNTGQMTDEPGSGWPNYGTPWHENYACADGNYISICPLEGKFYTLLLEKLDLTDNPVFANQWDQSQWAEGKRQLTALFSSQTRQYWCDRLEGTDVCFAPVLNMTEALSHPHNVARETFTEIEGVPQANPAPKLSLTPATPGKPPQPGQDTVTVLNGLGYDEAAIAELKASGII